LLHHNNIITKINGIPAVKILKTLHIVDLCRHATIYRDPCQDFFVKIYEKLLGKNEKPHSKAG